MKRKVGLLHPLLNPCIGQKTIARVQVLTGRRAIATHMTCLTSRSISLQLYGEDSCEKASFWSNSHSYTSQTKNGTQVEGDPKVPFLDPLWQLVEESPFVSKPCIIPLKQDTEQ
jgi:hypothetical protein